MSAAPKTSKAIVVRTFGEPDVLRVEDIPIPKPSPGQVLIKVHATGVNPADTYIRSGNYAALPTVPWIPGKDGAGIVESVGEGVTRVKPFERVWLSSTVTGTYAQYCLATHDAVHFLPEPFSFGQGAALWTAYATAYHSLYHIGEAKEGNTILVHGASGGVGMACLQWARLIPGATVIGTAGTEEGLKYVLENGAHVAFNHREPGYTEKIMEKTGSKGVDIVLEMLANVNLNADLQLLAKLGRVCVIGNRGTIDGFNARLLMQRRASVRGVMLSTITESEKQEIINAIENALKKIKITPLVGKQYPLSAAAQTHIDILNPPQGGQGGKVIINPWE